MNTFHFLKYQTIKLNLMTLSPWESRHIQLSKSPLLPESTTYNLSLLVTLTSWRVDTVLSTLLCGDLEFFPSPRHGRDNLTHQRQSMVINAVEALPTVN